MATDPQLVRAVALVHELARSRRGVSLRQFADRRGWNLRALYRDIAALERAGFPIQHEHGSYRLPEDWLPPASAGVTKDELIALFIARHAVPGLRGTGIVRALDSLWAKLSMKGSQARLVPEREVSVGTRGFAAIDYGVHAATIDTLQRAIAERRVVWIRYRRPNGAETDRDIEPGYLHWDGGLEAMYVPSWCRAKGAPRMFAVHRILAILVRDERFEPRASTSRRSLERTFRVWYRETTERVTIRFLPPIAGEIRERTWHPTQRLVDGKDGVLYLHLDIAAPEELERWLLGFGASARVVEPQRLADRLRDVHREAAGLGQVLDAARVALPARRSGRGGRRAARPPREAG